MILARVISGGQTGVDQAALRAAAACGIATGGWMSKGFKTLDGPKPGFATLYGMRENSSPAYEHRTAANVIDAHATLRIASVWSSPGEVCTLRAIQAADRPHLDVAIEVTQGYGPMPPVFTPRFERSVHAVVAWLRSLGDGLVLNVAGNSEQTAPGIGAVSETFLRKVFVVLAPACPLPGRDGMLARLSSSGVV